MPAGLSNKAPVSYVASVYSLLSVPQPDVPSELRRRGPCLCRVGMTIDAFEEADAETDSDAEAEAEADSDAEADTEPEAEPEADAEPEAEPEAEAEAGAADGAPCLMKHYGGSG